MTLSLNNVILLGVLKDPPEVKATTKGTVVLEFNLYVQSFDGKEMRIPCAAAGKTAEKFADLMQIGKVVGVQGKIQAREWTTRAGNVATDVKVFALDLTVADMSPQRTPASAPPAGAPPQYDDDIPF